MTGRATLVTLLLGVCLAALAGQAVAQDGDEEVCQADGTGACVGKAVRDEIHEAHIAEDGGKTKCHADGTGSCVGKAVRDEVHEANTAEDGIANDIHKMCPVAGSGIRNYFQGLMKWFGRRIGFHKMLSLWPEDIASEGWSDDYTTVNYLVVARIMVGLYWTRDPSWVKIPTAMATDKEEDLIRVENVHAPHEDIDGSPNFFWMESFVPSFFLKYAYMPAVTCFYSTLRRMSTHNNELNGTFEDSLDDPFMNTWEVVMNNTKYKKKVDWVMAFYDNAHSMDGQPLWPKQMTQFSLYFKKDEWEDRLEYAIAFHLIGAHRVEAGSWDFGNLPGIESVTLPFRVALNIFSTFEVRLHMGKYGTDLYFNEDGLPVLIKTPDGEIVLRGDKSWQYWKFVWRSTFITVITLVDHLHLAHFRTANLLSRAVREALDPEFPIRRLASIFTFGSIFVNLQAMHTLAGPNHLLHRATPFKEFTKLSSVVPSGDSGIITDITDLPAIKALMVDQEWEKLHPKLKEAPFFADGRLLVGAFRKLMDSIFAVSWEGTMCSANGTYSLNMKRMRTVIFNESREAHYALTPEAYEWLSAKVESCNTGNAKRVMADRLVAYFFIVTGWHRHVGFVGDYYADPELATMSWKDGEKFGRPRQHIITTIINVFTSTHQPLLKEDYSHLFDGMKPDLGKEYKSTWKMFLKDLDEIEAEINRRNMKREILNINMSPLILESAISK
mmetsp:Transcript_80018/g.259395  ORF Transcript_80018/g.259395 Transcript_80018/m.259395 type:complete len:724 (-) Transcript_80018:500-2671(-)